MSLEFVLARYVIGADWRLLPGFVLPGVLLRQSFDSQDTPPIQAIEQFVRRGRRLIVNESRDRDRRVLFVTGRTSIRSGSISTRRAGASSG